jgi:integrase
VPKKRLPSKLHLLSVREVQTAGEGDLSDGAGLILRVRGTNAAWVFRYTAATGKRREMGLGPVHRGNATQAGQSLTSARDLAAAARSLIQQGLDPIDERERRRGLQREEAEKAKAERQQQSLTLARAARAYHERVIEPTRTEKHAAQWISSLENHVPPGLWHKPVHLVEAPELLAALLAIRPHERARNLSQGERVPETVQRIRQRLDAVFEDSIFHGYCAGNPAAAIKRKLREGMPRKRKGAFAALPYAEAPAFMQRLRAAEGIAARCLEFGMLTVGRTGELIEADATELDLDQALWVIDGSRMKAGEPHTVYLCERAVAIAREMLALPKHPDAKKHWLFPSPDLDGKPLSNGAMLALLDRLGVRDRTTVHGLCRATFSTWANETGAARPDVIEACLAHEESNRVRAAYNRSVFAAERRALLAAWADYLDGKRARRTRSPAAANVMDTKAAAHAA